MHPVPAGKEQITMRGISRTNRWGSVLTGLAEPWRQPSPPDGTDNGARDTISADMSPAEGWPSFRRIVPIPFTAWLAALDSWQLTKRGGQLRLGQSLLRGPAEHYRHFRTCYIEARLARGPLRPPVRMRLGIDQWSATSTALELIPCRNVRPSPPTCGQGGPCWTASPTRCRHRCRSMWLAAESELTRPGHPQG